MAAEIKADPYDFPTVGALTPGDTALMIIDMQADFCAPGGYIAALGYDIEPLRRPIAPAARALAAARAAGVHVIHTRQGYRPDLAEMTEHDRWRWRRNGLEPGAEGPLGRIFLRGEGGWQIVPELAPLSSETVIDKTANDAFIGTDIESVLFAKRIRHLVFAGNTIDCCVHSTLRSANDRGYLCLLLADCCGAVDADMHRAAVRMVKIEGGVHGAVADADAFIAGLQAVAGRQRPPYPQ